MPKENHIQYLYDRKADIELILSIDSAISYPLHNHVSVLTIGLVLCGSIFLTVGDHSFACERDHSFMIPPYVPHAIKAQKPYSLLTLCIGKSILSKCSKDEIKNNIRRLLTAVREPELTENRTGHLLDCLDSLDKALLPHSTESFIDSARKQIERYPEMKISLDEMTRSLYVSKYHFIRSFKQAVGLTPHQFQIQNRVRKAQHLLSSTDNITEVALIAGFYDQSHFIRHFEKYIGLTPAVYKISCRILA